MSTQYEDIKETLDSPGAKLIVRELRKRHKAAFRAYRKCGDMDQLLNLQTLQKVIDTVLPGIIQDLMNAHLVAAKKKPEWSFMAWVRQIRFRG